MPWKTSSLLEARQRFIRAALRSVKSIAQLCCDFGISQKTGFKWLRRFRELGGPGLHEQSRRPKQSPRRTSDQWLKAIAQLRLRHPSWGAKKIYAVLRREHRRSCLPKIRTIANCLKRLGLTKPRRAWARRGPRIPRPALTIPKAANEVWTVDFKGWFRTGDGRRVDPLTVRDLFSRFVLGIVLLSHHHDPVRLYFQKLFARYGLPKIIRVDHGGPFAGDGALDLSRLSAWWLRVGIGVEFTRRARPQDNGAHEQMHRVYRAEVASPPAANARAQQWRTTRWIKYYNYHRPHEALEQRVPASLYRKSQRRYRGVLPQIKYPRRWHTRRVSISGHIFWCGRLRVIGRAFGEQCVGLKLVSEGVHDVYFMRQLIGQLHDADPSGMRPAYHEPRVGGV